MSAPGSRRFEGRIFRRRPVGAEELRPVAHFSTVALSPDISDFGGGPVTRLGTNDVFVVLFEYRPESIGRRLFAPSACPAVSSPNTSGRTPCAGASGAQSGTQWFFTENGRPFTLYAVLDSHARRHSLIVPVNSEPVADRAPAL